MMWEKTVVHASLPAGTHCLTISKLLGDLEPIKCRRQGSPIPAGTVLDPEKLKYEEVFP
jgi:hypothetical protein